MNFVAEDLEVRVVSRFAARILMALADLAALFESAICSWESETDARSGKYGYSRQKLHDHGRARARKLENAIEVTRRDTTRHDTTQRELGPAGTATLINANRVKRLGNGVSCLSYFFFLYQSAVENSPGWFNGDAFARPTLIFIR